MKEIILNIVNQPNNKKIIIFLGVLIFAIQSLVSIIFVSVNFPISDDWPAVFAGIYYQQNDSSWIDAILSGGGEHFLYFYRLVMMGGFLLNSFDVQQFMFLNWGFLLVSTGIFYSLLKKTDARLTWLIIPLSAFIFSPKMVSTDLTASIGLIWIGTFFFLVSIVVILDKQKLSKFWFALAICLSIIATTTSALGLLSWIIGALFLILRYKENKKNLLIWIGISIIIFSMYVVNIGDLEGRKGIDEIISFSGISWGLEYVSNPFSVKFLELKILIGVISIILLISVSAYLLKKRIRLAYPWILFGIIGVLSTILTDFGRFGIRLPSENYFIIMSTFTQIGLLVVVSILFFKIKKSNHKKKNLITIIYIVFVVSQLILLSSAYFVGSQYVSEWDSDKSDWLTCFDLPSNLEVCNKWNVFGDPLQNRDSLESKLSIYNYLIENKLSIFSNKEFFLDQEQKKNELKIEWNKLNEGSGVGEIESINGQNISNDSIILDNDYVNMSGWIIGNNGKIDEIFLFVNKEVFLSSSNLEPPLETIKKFEGEQDGKIKWSIVFLSGFLEKGCYNISIGGAYNDSKFMLDKELEICKI
jgi:hypothetical protein